MLDKTRILNILRVSGAVSIRQKRITRPRAVFRRAAINIVEIVIIVKMKTVDTAIIRPPLILLGFNSQNRRFRIPI